MMKKVLVVSNSMLTREVLLGPLTERGFEVLSAEDTWEAISLFGRQEVDLLVVDLDWPEDDGWSGWELIKGARGAEPPLPILLLTGRGELAEAARAVGVCGMAEKPVDVAALVKVAERLVMERGAQAGRPAVPRAGRFEHIPADGKALRAAILERFQRSLGAIEHYEHWGLNE
jgi:DNA-binding NtrC family response regulator